MNPRPNFHDGYVDGVLVEKETARIFVRTVSGERFTIELSGVKSLVLDDFRPGSIILDVEWLDDAKKISDHAISRYYYRPANPTLRAEFIRSIEGQQLRGLGISPSYGAGLVAIFKEYELKSGYLQK
jgi:hypothetical protein